MKEKNYETNIDYLLDVLKEAESDTIDKVFDVIDEVEGDIRHEFSKLLDSFLMQSSSWFSICQDT